MDNFPVPFSAATTNPLIPNVSGTTSFSSNIIIPAQQNMAELTNFNFPVDKTGEIGFPDPYFGPYDQNMHFQQMNPYPLHTLPTPQRNGIYGPPNSEVQTSVGPLTSKVARDKRKKVRQKSKNVAPTAPLVPTKGTKEKPVSGRGKLTINLDRTTTVFCSPDGKKLEQVFTKQLKNSDVSVLGRIVLPKREVEAKLPPLTDKEGKDIIVKDVYSEKIWSLKYKKQYVWARKMRNLETPVCSSNMESSKTCETDNLNDMKQSTNEDAYLEFFTKLNRKKDVEEANKLLTSFNGGGSSSSGAKSDMNIAQHDLSNTAGKGAPNQTTAEATPTAPTTPLDGNNMPISDEDVYGGLDNIFEIENSSWF
ncbi:B3 domain-containing transcription factor LEC2 Protein LEAFY COTYLEDON 2 [Vigna angularis]|uniref:B3 domain-containing transcription factor LEC2 Protein LEAFY COTYLEDON 2 n=1 Tax=Phaseolus angularis TaxID=3914 RepID=A0A8T0LDX7_PHAAN|nr:B3 domain-containing transcription factor LEC2 Protein LEAFY COTYLEDON 2 [Vigna angularis]